MRLRRDEILKLALLMLALYSTTFLGFYFMEARQRALVRQVDALFVRSSFLDLTRPGDDETQLALAREMLKLLSNRLADYRPYLMQGDVYANRGDYQKAETNYEQALRAMDSPRLIKSEMDGALSINKDKAERALKMTRRFTLKKIDLIHKGIKWKSPDDITRAVREDLKKQKVKTSP